MSATKKQKTEHDEMPTRRCFIGGNWKCNGTQESIKTLVAGLNQGTFPNNCDAIVAPTSLHTMSVLSTINKSFKVAAQNVSATGTGAFTGEVAAAQLVDAGLEWCITGHSERRALFGETNAIVANKTVVALKAGMSAIACIGESLAQREADETMAVLIKQLSAIGEAINVAFKDADGGAAAAWRRVVIAYEPVWAIGTGKVATPAQAQDVHQQLREFVSKTYGQVVADTVRIIYGGSVKPKNCDELIVKADIDGFLVGGASLKAPDFLAILQSTRTSKL